MVAGQIPADRPHALQTYQVADPPAFARTLLIEALGRAGVTVAATATGPNPVDKLPPSGSYAAADRVALLSSLPFSENIKLIIKVSMNQHADMLILLLALKHGQTTFDAGLAQIPPFLEQTGIDPDAVSLSDGRGNEYTDLFSPRTVSRLLPAMTTRPDFPAYFDALPILGVDGTEVDTVAPTSPVRGKAVAKSGTTVAGDLMNQRLLVMTGAGRLPDRQERPRVDLRPLRQRRAFGRHPRCVGYHKGARFDRRGHLRPHLSCPSQKRPSLLKKAGRWSA